MDKTKNNMRPWLTILLIIIILVVGTFLGWYLAQITKATKGKESTGIQTPSPKSTPSPTATKSANKVSYKDKTYGFSLEYPVNWHLSSNYQKGVNASYIDQSQSCTTVADISYTKENNSRFSLENGMDLQIVYCPEIKDYPDMNKLLEAMKNGQIFTDGDLEGIIQKSIPGSGDSTWDSAVVFKKDTDSFYKFSWNANDQNNSGWSYENIGEDIIKSFNTSN